MVEVSVKKLLNNMGFIYLWKDKNKVDISDIKNYKNTGSWISHNKWVREKDAKNWNIS